MICDASRCRSWRDAPPLAEAVYLKRAPKAFSKVVAAGELPCHNDEPDDLLALESLRVAVYA